MTADFLWGGSVAVVPFPHSVSVGIRLLIREVPWLLLENPESSSFAIRAAPNPPGVLAEPVGERRFAVVPIGSGGK